MAENDRIEMTPENFDTVARNLVAAQAAIKEVEGKTEARIKEGEAKAEKLVKDAMDAQAPMNRARILGDLAGDYSMEYDTPFERAMHDKGPHARQLKGQPLSATEAKIARFQELNDKILMGAQALGLGLEIPLDGAPMDADTARRNESKLRNSTEQSKLGRKLWKEFDAIRTELRAVTTMDTGTEVAPWVPTIYSPQLINRYTLALKLGALFQTVEMPSTTYRMPVMFAREAMTNSMPGEQTGALTVGTGTTTSPTGLYCTLEAKKSHKITFFSQEADWDSIIPMLPMLQMDHADWHAYCTEQALVNGDTTSTHSDTGWAPGATDYRHAWKGLRHWALLATTCKTDMSAVANAGATAGSYGVLNMRYIRGLLDVYGTNPKDCGIVMGPANFIRLINDTLLLTMDKLGPNATLLNGELAEMDGMPVIVSECYPSLTDANGIYGGSGNSYYSVCMFNHRQFYLGNRLGFQTGFSDLSVLYGVKAIASWKRTAFIPKQTVATAYPFCWVGYKFSPTA